MKKTISCFLIVTMLAAIFCMPGVATAPKQTITYFEDGSYVIRTIIEDPNTEINTASVQATKSGTSYEDYYSSGNERLFRLYVEGTFTYNGSTARATSANYDYTIYNSAWSFVSGNASYSGATATSTGKFRWLLTTQNATATLSCTPDGELY